jgi:hypothetical protein
MTASSSWVGYRLRKQTTAFLQHSLTIREPTLDVYHEEADDPALHRRPAPRPRHTQRPRRDGRIPRQSHRRPPPPAPGRHRTPAPLRPNRPHRNPRTRTPTPHPLDPHPGSPPRSRAQDRRHAATRLRRHAQLASLHRRRRQPKSAPPASPASSPSASPRRTRAPPSASTAAPSPPPSKPTRAHQKSPSPSSTSGPKSPPSSPPSPTASPTSIPTFNSGCPILSIVRLG